MYCIAALVQTHANYIIHALHIQRIQIYIYTHVLPCDTTMCRSLARHVSSLPAMRGGLSWSQVPSGEEFPKNSYTYAVYLGVSSTRVPPNNSKFSKQGKLDISKFNYS